MRRGVKGWGGCSKVPRPERQRTLHALQDAPRESEPAPQGLGLAELVPPERPLKNKKPLPGDGRGLKAKFD